MGEKGNKACPSKCSGRHCNNGIRGGLGNEPHDPYCLSLSGHPPSRCAFSYVCLLTEARDVLPRAAARLVDFSHLQPLQPLQQSTSHATVAPLPLRTFVFSSSPIDRPISPSSSPVSPFPNPHQSQLSRLNGSLNRSEADATIARPLELSPSKCHSTYLFASSRARSLMFRWTQPLHIVIIGLFSVCFA